MRLNKEYTHQKSKLKIEEIKVKSVPFQQIELVSRTKELPKSNP